jgi:hypothetical protein
MLTVRRIYFYAVSCISLVAVVWAIIALARLLLDGGIGQGQIIGLAWALAVIIVGLPIFLFHWLLAQKFAADSPDEAQSPIRYAFLYIVMVFAAVPVLSNLYNLLDRFFIFLTGGIQPQYYPYDMSVADHLVAMAIWAIVWAFVWRFTRQAGNGNPAADINLSIRRMYLLLFSLAGLIILTWGTLGLLQTLMEMLTGSVWRTPVANYSAQVLVGAGIWAGHWVMLQIGFTTGQPAEERSILRKVYLYLVVFVFSILALTGGTLLLKRIFELLLGAPPTTEPLLSQLSTVVPMLVVGGLMWVYHWTVVRQDAAQSPDGPRQAAVRRIYAYVVATVGLWATLFGIGGLLTLLVELLTDPPAIGFSAYRETVALNIALTLVGTPVWWVPWQARQRWATLPATDGDPQSPGSAERRSLVRKIYLYLFAFVAALVVFGSIGWFVFHLLTAVLGADLPTDFLTLVLNALVIGLLALAIWLYHWWVIRQDNQLANQEQARQLSRIVVSVVDGGHGRLGQAVLARLARELPGLRLIPAGLTQEAVTTMDDGQPFSPEAVQPADYIVGSWDILSDNRVAPVIGSSSATKFVVPISQDNWLWAGVTPRSPEAYAEQIARGIKQSIEGEAVTYSPNFNLVTIAGILLGSLLFLFIAFGVIILGINML